MKSKLSRLVGIYGLSVLITGIIAFVLEGNRGLAILLSSLIAGGTALFLAGNLRRTNALADALRAAVISLGVISFLFIWRVISLWKSVIGGASDRRFIAVMMTCITLLTALILPILYNSLQQLTKPERLDNHSDSHE